MCRICHMPFKTTYPRLGYPSNFNCPTLYYMNWDLACSVGVGWGWPLECWSTQNCGLLELLSQELHISVPADKQMQARWSKSSIGIPTFWIWTLFQCCRLQQNMNKEGLGAVSVLQAWFTHILPYLPIWNWTIQHLLMFSQHLLKMVAVHLWVSRRVGCLSGPVRQAPGKQPRLGAAASQSWLTMRHSPGQDLFRLKWLNLAARRKFGRLWSITFSLVVTRLSSGERPVLLQFLIYPSCISS